MTDEVKINPKHIAVVEAYLTNGFKREDAAQSAGYKETRLRQTASDIFNRPDVKAYLANRLKEMQMSSDEALYRLGGHAAGNVTEFIGLTIDELKAHPRAALIKRVKFVTHFPEPVVMPVVMPVDDTDSGDEHPDGEDKPSVQIDYPKPVQYVESIELYDAQAAMLNVIKQSQLTSGQPTENVNIPQLVELVRLLTAAGKDPTSVISRMVDKLKADAGQS